MRTIVTAAAAFAAILALSVAGTAEAKDYILTSVKPDQLIVVDAEARAIAHVHTIPDAAPGALTLTPSPDGKVAYAIVNRWESASGIDLDTGEEVFRADFSSGDERVKAMFGMDISPDGSELAVFQSPVRLGQSEYEVQPTRIAFYDTGAGKGAPPVRTIPAPRQITLIMYSSDGSKLYGLGRAVHVIDVQTGEILEEHATQEWDRPDYAPPDILDAWSQWEQAGILTTPYYTLRTDMDPEDPEAYVTGLLSINRQTGEVEMVDVENTDTFYFSSVASPTDPKTVYAIYNVITKLDAGAGASLGRGEVDHSYYAINISSDGSELYVGGTLDDIAVFDAETLEKIGEIKLPGGANQALSSLRVFQR